MIGLQAPCLNLVHYRGLLIRSDPRMCSYTEAGWVMMASLKCFHKHIFGYPVITIFFEAL
uniref:Uncharacterized protein n=1 Tax=Anguilla anguilla TaxID=7936 RepID=A0A0E9RT32_ANGAN